MKIIINYFFNYLTLNIKYKIIKYYLNYIYERDNKQIIILYINKISCFMVILLTFFI